jgi:glucose-1-phosphate thymidylyltransferase
VLFRSKEKGEYQLTNAMENMKNKGMQFVPGKVDEWLDCGNYAATVYTNQRVLVNKANQFSIDPDRFDESVTINEPCFVADGVQLKNCEIGPFVSIGNNSSIENCVIRNTIVQNNSHLKNFKCVPIKKYKNKITTQYFLRSVLFLNNINREKGH